MHYVLMILVCFASTPRDQCDEQSALDVTAHEASALECVSAVPMEVTGAGDPRGLDGLYMKSLCRRETATP